ncbi:unnamed protein product [Arctia plantaginis]|uniref:RRM domain-containing protein n=1 Tax=Arctia plantaginis TaxID=874455 RepID=A0A8S1BTT7_ARCPL|nr:unnamed protein product [Arctia plantaginis]CAB3261924.1 unnamed protein product [Arctia plantaginis]
MDSSEVIPTPNIPVSPKPIKKVKREEDAIELGIRYPILKNELLVQRFLKVPMTNNQKGRIRQAIKESLQGSSNAIVPDIVHGKIQAILKNNNVLTDSHLRRIRILYNLLTNALRGEKIIDEPPHRSSSTLKAPSTIKAPSTLKMTSPKALRTSKSPPVLETIKEKPQRKLEKRTNESPDKEKPVEKKKKDQLVKKVRGPKRYVVFLGNLPLDINKDKIMAHFSEMNEHIKSIRIPKPREEKKSAIAFMELTNEASYEFALSKHHSMLGRKRINVLYTAQKHGRVTVADAKSKSAKLIALQRSGKLVGSTALVKKRSQRRLKKKLAQAKEAQDT